MSKIGKVFFDLQEQEDAYLRQAGPSYPRPAAPAKSNEAPPPRRATMLHWRRKVSQHALPF